MERKAKFVVRLDESERGRLQEMVDRGKGSKTIRNRALILLRADEGEHGPGWTDAKIAEAFEVGVRTVERTRRLLVVEGFEAGSPGSPRSTAGTASSTACRRPSWSSWRAPSHRRGGHAGPCSCWPMGSWSGRWWGPSGARRSTTLQKTTSSRGSGSSGFCPRRPTRTSSVRWKTSSKCTNGPTTRSPRSSASTSRASN